MDKRKYPRTPAEFSCVIRRVLPDGTEAPHQMVKTRNIGAGGMLVETELQLAAGEAMRMVIVIGDHRFEAHGRVIFGEAGPAGLRRYGVQFTDIRDEDRDLLVATHLARVHGLER